MVRFAEVEEIHHMPQDPILPTPTSIPDLIARISNDAQKQALQRLLVRNENSQMYLANYEPNLARTGRTADVEGTFTILGTLRNGTRESYTVRWHRWRPVMSRPSFWCNCPDHKFNAVRKNMVCKHICFLVTRVGRILDPAFFDSKTFTREQHTTFQDCVRNAVVFDDGTRQQMHAPQLDAGAVVAQASVDRKAPFLEIRRPVAAGDACPICYDEMEGNPCLNCPTCSNNVHRECMEVWLERNRTCVFCRSDVWCAWNM